MTNESDLDWGNVCDHDIDLGYVGSYNQWIWSWLRWCLRPRYWSWIRRFLWPMNLILTEVMFVTKILILTKGMSRASHPRHQVVACKSQNLELVSNWWVLCCSLVFFFFFFFFLEMCDFHLPLLDLNFIDKTLIDRRFYFWETFDFLKLGSFEVEI